MFAPLLAFAALAVTSASAQTTIDSVTQAFDNASIVPDVLPTFAPMGLLDVVFFDNTTNTNVTVTPGLNMTREQNALRPTVSFQSNVTSFANTTFVLAMVDPDAPTPQMPTSAQIRHMLAPGMTLDGSLADGALLVNNTPAISNFIRPTPPAGSDPHRYILLLFVEPTGFDATAAPLVNASTAVSNFNISQFAAAVGLGDPVAGNFFLTGPDNTSSASSTAASSSATAAATDTGSGSTSGNTGGAMRQLELSVVGIATGLVLVGSLML